MHGTNAQRKTGGMARYPESPQQVRSQPAASSRFISLPPAPPTGQPSADATRNQRFSFLRPYPSWAPSGHRLPAFLVAVALHGLLLALFLLSQRGALRIAAPIPAIQTEIISEPQAQPAPPPLKPVALTPAPVQIVVPVVRISIPDAVAAPMPTTPVAHTVAATPVASTAPAAPPAPISAPRFDAAYLHNPAPEYPFIARKRHERGTVMLRVEVSAQGGALQVLVEQSSGWPVLDDAALSAVRHWRFEPARQGNSPVAAWVLVPVEFNLKS